MMYKSYKKMGSVHFMCFFSSLSPTDGLFVGYSQSIHGIFICIGYVSVMCRLCIGYLLEHIWRASGLIRSL